MGGYSPSSPVVCSIRSCSETDITSVFGTAIPGSSPGGSTMNQNCIGGVDAEVLRKRFGTPLYVYDAAVVQKRCGELTRAFAGMQVHYAVKANANPALLKLIKKEGFGAEAVSVGELLVARRAGFPKDRISFTGPSLTE